MDFQKLLQNKKLVIGVAAAIAVVIVIMFALAIFRPQSANSNVDPDDNKKIEGTVELVTSDNLGKIIEIEALLARHKIQTQRLTNGSKVYTKK